MTLALEPLPIAPSGPVEVPTGLWQGPLLAMPSLPGRGRTRRWMYGAAASTDGATAVGAAMVQLGFAATTFVWLLHDGELRTWDRTLFPWLVDVGERPDIPSDTVVGGQRVRLDAPGSLFLALRRFDGGALDVDLVADPTTPVVCSTATPAGGTNVTQKAAGHRVTGNIRLGERHIPFDGHGWTDWTVGRQDRQTAWRWAAGAGRTADGRTVGLNVSTGMNEAEGEDVAWIDGIPVPLDLHGLGPTHEGDFAGPWSLHGSGWHLDFTPVGVRAATENLGLVRSRYVQPVGQFHGTLPTPEGGTVEVTFPGVTEDHEARW